MDRRTVLALVLVAAVILLTPRLFPPPPPSPLPQQAGDSAAVMDTTQPVVPAAVAPAIQSPPVTQTPAPDSSLVRIPAETLTVADSNAAVSIVNSGGSVDRVVMRRFSALGGREGPVVLDGRSAPLLRFRGIAGRDTVSFDTATFRILRREVVAGGERVELQGIAGTDTLTLDYLVKPDSFLIELDGRVSGPLATSGYILLDLAPTLASYEADSVEHQRSLSFAYETSRRDAKGTGFGSLDPGEREIGAGPLNWVALKSKYFIIGILARDTSASPIAEFNMTGLPRLSRIATHAQGTAVIAPRQGAFALDIYAGPQQAKRLQALGRGFQNSNPYGGFLQPVVQPFAGLVLNVLLWMRHTFNIGYGWVLVIFGVAVRVILWPLNQKAMRTSMKMQRMQPELQAVQAKYKSDPAKFQAETMRVYKEHGMSPFSVFSGCLPLLLPMPVLFALFFVFQSTIEFRGVSFLWLSDISLKDPYYILPLVMGASMFVLSWIGSRNTPPNPQTKMMMYLFPAMMTFLLANFASGLNLYYTVQNIAALPQQWLIATERAKAAPPKPKG